MVETQDQRQVKTPGGQPLRLLLQQRIRRQRASLGFTREAGKGQGQDLVYV